MDMATLATVAGGVANSAASVYNNNQSIKFQREANSEQIKLANTAHQREVRDLIAAGLNPVLSASGAGASVPQLGSPSLENFGQGLSEGVQSAARMSRLEIPQLQSQLALNNSTSARNMADVNESAQRAEQMRLENEFNSATMQERIAIEKWHAAHPDILTNSEGVSILGSGHNRSTRSPVDNEFYPSDKKKLPFWKKLLLMKFDD